MKKLIGIASFIGLFSMTQVAYAADLFQAGEILTADKLNDIDQRIMALEGAAYTIGDVGPAGGWVFYVTNGGLHGLEAAPSDQNSPFNPGAAWGCHGTLLAGADGTVIGAGAQNTGDILTGCMEPSIAARIAGNYWLNGYNDWYLPSKDELNLMYLNIGPGSTAPINVGGFDATANGYYWSSSESNDFNASAQIFDGTGQIIFPKLRPYGVRAIRAF